MDKKIDLAVVLEESVEEQEEFAELDLLLDTEAEVAFVVSQMVAEDIVEEDTGCSLVNHQEANVAYHEEKSLANLCLCPHHVYGCMQ